MFPVGLIVQPRSIVAELAGLDVVLFPYRAAAYRYEKLEIENFRRNSLLSSY